MTEIQELAQSFNMNERELVEYVQSVGRVLNENFMRDVFDEKITLKEAIIGAVKLWDKKQKHMSMQLMEGRRGADKLKLFSNAIVDTVYEALNR